MKENRKSIKINVVFNMTKTLCSVILPLITYSYVTRTLGVKNIGISNFVTSVVGYFQLFASLGISTYAISEGAKIRDNNEKFSKFCSEIFCINIITTIFTYIVLVVSALAIPFFKEYGCLLIISGLSIIFSCIGTEWIFGALEEYQYISIRSILMQLVSLIAIFIFVREKNDIYNYVFILIIPTILSGCINFAYSKHLVKINFSNITFPHIIEHLKPILIIWGMSIASTIYINSDTIMITIIKGNEAAGYYSVATKASHVVCLVLNSVGAVLLPRLSNYIENGKSKEFVAVIGKVISIILMLIVPCVIGLFMLNKETVFLLGGKQYLLSKTAARIMAFNVMLSPINGLLATQVLIPLRKEKISFYATILGAILNIGLNLYFIQRYSFEGAAVTTVLAELAVCIFCLIYLRNILEIRTIMHELIQYFIASIPIYFICVNKYVVGTYSLEIAICILGSVFCYFIVLHLLKNKSLYWVIENLLKKRGL